MPFPPNLGITSALIIDSRSPILLPDFPSLLLPQLPKANMNAYSRIGKSKSTRSKSLDFADLSFINPTPTTIQGSNINSISKLQSHQRNTSHSPIPETLGTNRPIASGNSYGAMNDHQNLTLQYAAKKKKRSNRRSASLFDGYYQIHHQFDSIAEDVDQAAKPYVKKKGRFFKACKRLFGL